MVAKSLAEGCTFWFTACLAPLATAPGQVADAGVAEDGQKAVDLADARDYALILMDVQMPTLNGIEATQAIRAGQRNRDVPIIAISANAFAQDRADCLAAGMQEHIVKPVEPQALYRALLTWLRAVG